MLTTQATRLTCIAALVLTLAACGDKGASNTQGGASGATNTVILPFLMDRISKSIMHQWRPTIRKTMSKDMAFLISFVASTSKLTMNPRCN